MTAKECITGRRSIRQYTDQPVSHELLAQIVEMCIRDRLCGCVLCQCLSLADRRYFSLDRLSFPYEEDGEGQKGS